MRDADSGMPRHLAAIDAHLAALAEAAQQGDWSGAGPLLDELQRALAAATAGGLERGLLHAVYRRARVAVDELQRVALLAQDDTRAALATLTRGRRALDAYA